MKKTTLFGFIVMAIQLTACNIYSQVSSSDEYQNTPANNASRMDDVSFQGFCNDLSLYGRWIQYPNYGYAWQPAVGSNFRPYATNGHWAYTDM